LTESYLCHACSDHETEDGNARTGNDDYGGWSQLPNCVADAEAMADMAREMRTKAEAEGGEHVLPNATLAQTKRAVSELRRDEVWPGSLVTVYFRCVLTWRMRSWAELHWLRSPYDSGRLIVGADDRASCVSGHGAEHDGTNYLLPLGMAEAASLDQLVRRAASAGVRSEQLQQARDDAAGDRAAEQRALVGAGCFHLGIGPF
jgi:hypothetical protein